MVAVGGLFHGPVKQVGRSEGEEGGNGNKEPKTGNCSHGNLLFEIYLQKKKKAQLGPFIYDETGKKGIKWG
jgi:hypothetical protein